MKIAVIGSGYVGLVAGVCFADWGHDVVCVDNDAKKIELLRSGGVPIYEPGLDEALARGMSSGRLSFTRELAEAVSGAEAVFVAVGTPPRHGSGEADMSFVYAAAREIAAAVSGGTVIVTKSTVPVGTGDAIARLVERTNPSADISVASNPEFLREGTAIRDFLVPDRVVFGVQDKRAADTLSRVYASLDPSSTRILITARRTAELMKYAANAFLAMKVTFINEIADLCEQVGARVQDVALGVGLDPRIGAEFLKAGPGYGGSCFPKDTLALLRVAQDYGVSLRLVEQTVAANEARKRRIALKVTEAVGGSVEGLNVAVLGLTFKADTDDLRDSPSLSMIEALQRGGANVRAYDPAGIDKARAILQNVEFAECPYACAEGVDAVVVMTEWASLKTLDLQRLHRRMRTPVLIDMRNMFEPEELSRCGFSHVAVGSPSDAARPGPTDPRRSRLSSGAGARADAASSAEGGPPAVQNGSRIGGNGSKHGRFDIANALGRGAGGSLQQGGFVT